jgi:hypothetical protein
VLNGIKAIATPMGFVTLPGMLLLMKVLMSLSFGLVILALL